MSLTGIIILDAILFTVVVGSVVKIMSHNIL